MHRFVPALLTFGLCLSLVACGGDDQDPIADDDTETSTGDGDGDPSGDGDGDPSTSGDGDGDGDPTTSGDGDPSGDGDGDPSTSGDGDGDPSGDGDGDPSTSGDGDGDGDPLLSFEADVYPIIASNCSCHLTMLGAGGLAMGDATTAYGNLVDVTSTQVPALARVAPTDPDNSYMVAKIEGTQGNGTQPMPPGGPLSQADQQLIRDWVVEGAAP